MTRSIFEYYSLVVAKQHHFGNWDIYTDSVLGFIADAQAIADGRGVPLMKENYHDSEFEAATDLHGEDACRFVVLENQAQLNELRQTDGDLHARIVGKLAAWGVDQ